VHIAFFNRSFYPDSSATGQLLTELCEDLVRHHGCRVSVVAGPALMPSAADVPAGKGLVSRREHHGIDVFQARGTTFDKRRFAGRAANYLTYFLSACWAGLRIDRPDVVVALTDPPIIGLAAWLAAKRTRAPLVMSYQDLFPEVTVLLEGFHSRTINAVLQGVNRLLCRYATRIVAIGETMRERLIDNKGAAPKKTVIIPNWADTAAIVPGSKHNAFAAANQLTDKFVVMHSGNIGLSQSLDTLLDAAALLHDEPLVQIVFQGDGVKKADLQARVRTLGLTNVRFLPFAPKSELGESFAAADMFIVSLQRGLAGYIVPSKLYGILAAGRPYVAAVEDTCEVAALTRARHCGLVAEPGSARDLADKILTFYRDPELMRRCGINARAAGLVFDRTVQVRNYMDLFTSLRPAAVRRPLPVSVEAGDLNRDGKTDLVMYRPSTSTWSALTSSTAYASGFTVGWGVATDTALGNGLVANAIANVPSDARRGSDFDGDRKADLTVYRPSEGGWYSLPSSSHYNYGSALIIGGWGVSTDVPVPGDYDGDGKTDILHAVNNTDYVHLWTSNGNGTFTVTTFSPWGGYAIPNGLWLPADITGDAPRDQFLELNADGKRVNLSWSVEGEAPHRLLVIQVGLSTELRESDSSTSLMEHRLG
jgi:glycosyltransferase involved in cell wall biosynthesis